MGKQGAGAHQALLAGVVAQAVPPARVGVGFDGSVSALQLLTPKSPQLLLSVRALHRASNCTAWALLYPHPRVSQLSPIRMGTPFPRRSGCCFVPALPATREPCQLPPNGLRLILVRQVMRVVEKPPL